MPIGPNGERLPYPGEPGYVSPEDGIDPLTGMPYSPDELSAMLGTYGDQLEMTDQQAQAQALRAAPGPEGRSSGRVYTAANPLEVLGDIGMKYAAKRKDDRAGRLQKKIGRNVEKYGIGAFGAAKPKVTVPASLAPPSAGNPVKLKIPEVY
jgi:hypothetical protein